MKSLRDRVLAAATVKVRKINVPEWGGELWLRQLPAEVYLSGKLNDKTDRKAWANDMADSLIDPVTGSPAFTAEEILQFNFTGFIKVQAEIIQFNALNLSLGDIKKKSRKTR